MNKAFGYGQAEGDERSRLIQSHLSTVSLVVDRMMCQVPSFLTRDDVTSAAMMGLLDAANRFDPARGILFKTFAEHRIRGAIFDEVRKMDWFSRSLRDKQSRVAEAMNALEHQLGRTPEEDEVAEAMGLALDEYRDTLGQIGHLGCVSLHETLDDSDEGRSFLDSLEDTDSKNPEERLAEHQLTHELAAHLEKLTEKERLVISLYYYEELSQKEIAEVLELSEGRVSQLHSQALLKLKVKMQKRQP